jgi:rare lipoprotein A
VEVRVNVRSSISSTGALAPKVLAIAILAVALATSGAVSGLAEAQAHTRAQAKAAAARRARARRVSVSRVLPTGWRRAKASWYGPGFYGHGMAGGGKLTKTSLVVAHKTLPFGTLVEFSHGGKTVIAPVRDRGPFISGREFDLGPGTARALGMFHTGTLKYRILGR